MTYPRDNEPRDIHEFGATREFKQWCEDPGFESEGEANFIDEHLEWESVAFGFFLAKGFSNEVSLRLARYACYDCGFWSCK